MLGDSIFYIPADSMSISLGIGLSITLKAGVQLPGWPWGTIDQWLEYLQLKQEALGSIPGGCPGFLFCSSVSSSWLANNVDGMKNLWCSSTVWLL